MKLRSMLSIQLVVCYLAYRNRQLLGQMKERHWVATIRYILECDLRAARAAFKALCRMGFFLEQRKEFRFINPLASDAPSLFEAQGGVTLSFD